MLKIKKKNSIQKETFVKKQTKILIAILKNSQVKIVKLKCKKTVYKTKEDYL